MRCTVFLAVVAAALAAVPTELHDYHQKARCASVELFSASHAVLVLMARVADLYFCVVGGSHRVLNYFILF